MRARDRHRAEPSIEPIRETAVKVLIRKAVRADLDALLALENASFVGDRADRRAIRHAIASPTMTQLAAITNDGADADVLVGAATLERRRGTRVARLSSIAVAPGRSGLGLGRRILEAAEADSRRHGCVRLRLEVRVDNACAIRLYERCGYGRYTVKDDYYEDGTTAWCYEKMLGSK